MELKHVLKPYFYFTKVHKVTYKGTTRVTYLIEVVDLLDALLQPLPAARGRLRGHLRRMLLRLPRGLPEAVVGEGRPLLSGLVVQRGVLRGRVPLSTFT